MSERKSPHLARQTLQILHPRIIKKGAMHPTITAAIISACITAISAIITLIVKERLTQRGFSKVEGRRSALIGNWRGIIRQTNGPDGKPFDQEIDASYTKKCKRILGTATFTPQGLAQRTLNFDGGFLHDQFIKLEYKNSDTAIMQFGCIVARLTTDHDERKVLNGRFLGYGPETQEIVYGTVDLKKIS